MASGTHSQVVESHRHIITTYDVRRIVMDVCLNNRRLEGLPSKNATRVRGFPWWVKIKQGSKGQTQSEKQECGARQVHSFTFCR